MQNLTNLGWLKMQGRESFLKFISLDDASRAEVKNSLEAKNWTSPSFIMEAVKHLEKGARGVLIRLSPEDETQFSFKEIHDLNPLLGKSLGSLLVQNENGDQVISVYDRDRLGSMFTGGRYHQTREGGSIHTDNVNIPELWDYLLLSCISPAYVGGESILVDGLKIHQELKERFSKVLSILESDFIWEMRGVKDELYRAPIITYDKDNQPLFRHLRPYMESAHQKAGEPMTAEQLYAVDVLDALTNDSQNQLRINLRKGDILITKDAQVLHGRSCFSDDLEAVSFDDFFLGKGKTLKRTMERLWIRKH